MLCSTLLFTLLEVHGASKCSINYTTRQLQGYGGGCSKRGLIRAASSRERPRALTLHTGELSRLTGSCRCSYE